MKISNKMKTETKNEAPKTISVFIRESQASLMNLAKKGSLKEFKKEVLLVKKVLEEKALTNKTKATYYSRIKEVFRDGKLLNPAKLKTLHLLNIAKEDTKINKLTYAKKIKEANYKLIKVLYYNDIIDFAYSLLESDDYIQVCNGLALITGRRSSELMKTASFSKVKKSIIFKGQLKEKNRDDKKSLLGYEINFLTTNLNTENIDFINKKIKFIRTEFNKKHMLSTSKLTPYEIQKIDNALLNSEAKRLFKPLFRLNSFKDLRALYICILSALKRNETTTQSQFFSDLLGHSITSKEVQASYNKYLIDMNNSKKEIKEDAKHFSVAGNENYLKLQKIKLESSNKEVFSMLVDFFNSEEVKGGKTAVLKHLLRLKYNNIPLTEAVTSQYLRNVLNVNKETCEKVIESNKNIVLSINNRLNNSKNK